MEEISGCFSLSAKSLTFSRDFFCYGELSALELPRYSAARWKTLASPCETTTTCDDGKAPNCRQVARDPDGLSRNLGRSLPEQILGGRFVRRPTRRRCWRDSSPPPPPLLLFRLPPSCISTSAAKLRRTPRFPSRSRGEIPSCDPETTRLHIARFPISSATALKILREKATGLLADEPLQNVISCLSRGHPFPIDP